MWFEVWEEISDEMALVVAAAAIVAVFYAVILRAATKLIVGLEVAFGQAYSTTLISWFMQAVAQVIVVGIGAVTKSPGTGDLVVLVMAGPASVVAQALAIRWRLDISFWQALLVSLLVMFIAGVLAALGVIGFIVWL